MNNVLEFITADGQKVSALAICDPVGTAAHAFTIRRSPFPVVDKNWLAKERERFDDALPFARISNIQPPPVPPAYYAEVYRRDPTVKAVIDACVSAVVGLGYSLRLKLEAEYELGTPYLREPDTAALSRRELIESAMSNCWPSLSFSDLLQSAWTDYEVTGNAYIEVVRGEDGQVDGFRHLKSVRARLSEDYTVCYETLNGVPVKAFALYGTAATAVLVTTKTHTLGRREVSFIEAAALIRPPGLSPTQIEKARADGFDIEETNEVIHFRAYTPKDTDYGEPPLLSAIEDYTGSLNARLFNISYFNNATVPRMIIVLRGVTELSPEIEQQIRNFIQTQEAMDALNKVLVLTFSEGVEMQVERLSREQLRDAGFLEYRQSCDDAIRRAYRVPNSWIGVIEGAGRQQSVNVDTKFLYGVIRPRQQEIEDAFNRVFKERMGITDWMLHMNRHQAVDVETFSRFVDAMMRHGAMTVNEVRREQNLPPIAGGDKAYILPMGMGVVPIEVIPVLAEAYKRGETGVLQMQEPTGQPGARPLGMTLALTPDVYKLSLSDRRALAAYLSQLQELAQHGSIDDIIRKLEDVDVPEAEG